MNESTKQLGRGTTGKTSVTVPDTEIWTTDDVAAYLKISPNMVREMAKKNRLPGAFRIETLWRYNAQKVREFASGGAVAA